MMYGRFTRTCATFTGVFAAIALFFAGTEAVRAFPVDFQFDGLAFYRRLAQEAPVWLKPGGKLMAEFGDEQDAPVREIFAAPPWRVEAIAADDTGRARILITHRD